MSAILESGYYYNPNARQIITFDRYSCAITWPHDALHDSAARMTRRIVIIQGHPDTHPVHFGHALAQAYAQGAQQGGHELRLITVATLDFPLLRTKEDWEHGTPPAAIADCQQTIAWADHLVIIYPLWLGAMPALLKAFLEQALRPGFALGSTTTGKLWEKKLKGKSARLIVTMGMPALFFRWFYGAHSLKTLQRNILAFCGIGPIKHTLIGLVDNARGHPRWLAKIQTLGSAGR